MADKICEVCNKKPATIFIKIDNDTINVCNDCAEKYNLYSAANSIFGNMANLFDMDFDFDDFSPARIGYNKIKERVCPKCGMRESELISKYKFGCSECYNVFADRVKEFFNDLRGQEYKGEFAGSEKPAQPASKKKRLSEMTKDDLPALNRLLTEAVKARDFDRAKAIDAKIRELEGGKTNG